MYPPYKEPLLDAYMTMKEQGSAANVNLSETWLQSYQVLPERTHPTVNMSGDGDISSLGWDHCQQVTTEL